MPQQAAKSLWPIGRRTSAALKQELERNKTLDVEKPLPATPKEPEKTTKKAIFDDRPAEKRKYSCDLKCSVM
jgi:hypothetical protein